MTKYRCGQEGKRGDGHWKTCLECARLYQLERRTIAKEYGFCNVCCKRNAIPGKSKCGVCEEYNEEYKIEYRKRSQWQPIETAPKDGTLIDVWDSHHNCRITDVFWSRYKNHWDIMVGSQYNVYINIFTHWMSLPKPPKGYKYAQN